MSTPRKQTPRKPPRAATPSRGPAMASAKKEKPSNDQGEEGIQVAIRMRPLNKHEGSNSRVWKVLPKFSSVAQTTPTGQPLQERVTGRTFFQFDKTFGEEVETQHVYENIAKGIVSSVCTGLNGTIFAYGQTSSGKTYTMQGAGTIQEGMAGGGGIVHLASMDIFKHVEQQTDRIFLIRASFLEIYNEEVRDLLTDENKVLQIREDPRRGVFVQSKEEVVTDFESLLGVLFKGEKSRAFASTAMNERSSRSHTIFRVTIESRKKSEGQENEDPGEDGDGAVLISTLNLVDLAGSESVRHTGATGDRQKEGGMINQSLLTLSRVIVALGTPNQGHINFRDSKLTRILQPSLSGNARMAVICCATPSELYLEETRSTLQFASRAKLVKTRAQVNEVLDDRSVIRRLQRELAQARRLGGGAETQEHVKALEEKAATSDAVAQEVAEKLRRLQASILNGDGLFGSAAVDVMEDTGSDDASSQPRKRRLSEGALELGAATPLKGAALGSSPKTMPRATKRGRKEPTAPLSPSTELSLVRQAMLAKNDMISSWKTQVSEISRQVQLKESELVAVNCSNDILRSERDSIKENLSSSIAALREDMEAASSAHETALKAKETAIEEALAKLEQELQDRRVLEQAVGALQEEKAVTEQQLQEEREANANLQETVQSLNGDKDSLVKASKNLETEKEQLVSEKDDLGDRFESLQEERVRGAFELAQSVSEKETMIKERQEDKERLQEFNGKIEFLTSTMNETQDEKDVALDELRSLGKQLEASQQEVEAKSHAIEEANATIETGKREQSSSQDALASLAEKSSSLAAENEQVKGELESANLTIGQLEASVVGLTEERDGVTASWESSKVDLEAAQQTSNSLELSLEKSAQDMLVQTEKIHNLTKDLGMHADTITELKGATSSSEYLLQEFRGELVALQALNESVEAQLVQVSEERNVAQSEVKDVSATVEKLTAEVAGLEGSAKEASSQLDGTHGRVEELESQLEGAVKERDGVRTELVAAHAKVTGLAATIEQLETTVDQTSSQVTELSLERDAALGNASELNEKLAEASNGLDTAQAVLEASNARIDELLEEKVAFVSSGEDHEAQAATRIQELETARAAVEASNNKADDLSTRIAGLDATAEETATKLECLTAEQETALSRVVELESQLQVSTQAFDSLQSTSQESKVQLADTARDLDDVQSELEASIAKVEELTTQVGCLDATTEETSVKLQGLTNEREAALARAAELELELEASKQALGGLQSSRTEVETQLNCTTAELDEARSQLEASSKMLSERVETQDESLAATKLLEESLKTELESTKVQLETASSAKDSLGVELSDVQKELQARTDELIKVHDLVESSNDRLGEAQKRASDLEDELESTESMLSQSLSALEEKRDELTGQLKEQRELNADLEERILQLSSSVADLTGKKEELEQLVMKTSPADAKIQSLESENVELKQLLSSSNTSIEEAREAALSADAELEEREQQLEETLQLLSQREEEARLGAPNGGEGDDELAIELEAAMNELENERSSRSQFEEDLKRLMGEEQRALIQEAEGSMEQLRKDVVKFEDSLKRSESEAYTARQENEELRDQGKRALQNAIQMESKVAALQNENLRLKRSVEGMDASKESDTSALSMELKQAKADHSAARQSLAKIEKKLQLVEQERNGTARELSSALESMSRVDSEALEQENLRLQDKVNGLVSKVNALKDGAGSSTQVQALQSQISEMKGMLKKKDVRIKKLDLSKLTKEKVAAIKIMKAERTEFKGKLEEAEKEIVHLRYRLSSTPQASREDPEISELRFDKEALESKLRKYLSHCQRLEEEKAGIIDVLRSSQHDDVFDGDISKTVVFLCDKLASLEEECESLSKAQNQASFYLKEVDQLRESNGTLQSQISESRKKVDHLVRSEIGLKEALATLRGEQEELRSMTDAAQGNAESVENEKSRQFRYLEQENLHLMLDLKSVKKQLQNTKAELNMLRAKALDDDTTELGVVAARQAAAPPRSKVAPKGRPPSTPVDKENTVNVSATGSSKARRAFGSIRKPRGTPGLGESFEQTEENTQECKQS